nr:MAG TPA: hypothetical protein [Caudoviricetes sp.]
MANKNITMQQKNTAGSYDKLYPKTTATQSKLSAETAALYGDGVTDADAAMRIVANTIKDLGFATVIVKDPSGNPIQGAIITGIQGSPTTDANGKASGVLQSATISVSSPYVDLQSKEITISGSFSAVEVTLPIIGENAIKRFTSSQSIKFSNVIKTVDVCCVGGGGGGSGNPSYQSSSGRSIVSYGPGGGGGGIVNSLGITPQKNVALNLIIGSGGSSGTPLPYNTSGSGAAGGISSFLSVSANGGGGGITRVYKPGSTYYVEILKGSEGSAGSGFGGADDGPTSNTTLSEFNDGSTFYSGGGAQGNSYRQIPGGLPYGASGSYVDYDVRNQEITAKVNAGSAGIGGGGGGGTRIELASASGSANPSSGGSGLVAIRFHF